MSSDFGHKLDLRTEMLPRGALIDALERQLGQRLTHEHRHYLDNRPVHCGDIMALCQEGRWVNGRFEWSGDPEDNPVFHAADGIVVLDMASRLRWP